MTAPENPEAPEAFDGFELSSKPLVASIGLAIGTLLIAMASIQFGASVAKQLFPLLGATGTTALRVSLAALLLGLIWRPWRGGLTRSQLSALLLYGAALGCMNLSFYLALERIPLGIAVALEFTGPLGLALYASRRLADLAWVGLALAGLLMLLPLGGLSAPLDPVGIAFALAAGLFWALYILFGQRASAALHGGRAAALGMVMAALIVLPVGIWQAGTRLLNPAILPFALLVAVLSSAIPYSLEMIALKRLPARTFGILMSLEPAMAALFGLLLLAERLSGLQWLAIACIMAASAGSALGAHDAHDTHDTQKEPAVPIP